MNFAAPLLLGLGALAVPVTILYILKVRRRDVRVPYLRLWEQLVVDTKARALFKHAVEAAKSQDWATAWKALRAANHHEPGNAFLETRFKQVDAMLRKGG